MASGSLAVDYQNFSYKGKKADILDNASLIIEYANGIRANFELCMFSPLPFEELVICGDGGRIKAFEQGKKGSPEEAAGVEIYRGELHTTRICEPRYRGAAVQTGHSDADFFAQRTFIEVLEGKIENAPTVLEGFWAVVVGVAAEEAVRTGQPVEIDALLKKKRVSL